MINLIEGIEVNLREPPSSQQFEILKTCLHIFEAEKIEKGKHAFLEAYEGTGRVEALLITSLAWLKHHLDSTQENSKNKVVFISTDCEKPSRILKNTNYADVSVVLLNSPDQMNLFDKAEDIKRDKLPAPVVICTTQEFFFHQVLSRKTFSLEDSILIVDDAHVVEYTSRDAASKVISHCYVGQIIKDLVKRPQDPAELLTKLIDNLQKFQRVFDREYYVYKGSNDPCYYSGPQLVRDPIFQGLNSADFSSLQFEPADFVFEVFNFISHICQFHDSLKMLIYENNLKGQHIEGCKGCRTLNLLCFDASIIIRKIVDMEPHTLIFTSASISSFEVLMEELGISEKALVYSCKPFIEDYHIFARQLICGAGGCFLNSSKQLRSDEDYQISVGKTLLEILKITPHGKGVIVYFTSKDLLNKCKDRWKKSYLKNNLSLWENIVQCKETFAVASHDPSYPSLVSAEDVRYSDVFMKLENSKSAKDKGTCILSVLRGELSEDLNIPPDARRVLMVVGVPFIPTGDPKVNLKITFNQQLYNEQKKKYLPGTRYSQREAYKAVKRVVDRQIDIISQSYGVILLCDMRFEKNLLSPWIQETIETEKRFEELLQELKDFFKVIDQRIEWKKAKSDPTQVSTQFPEVSPAAVQKVQLQYYRLKKKNDQLAGYKEMLQDEMITLDKQMEELQQTLIELNTTDPPPSACAEQRPSSDEKNNVKVDVGTPLETFVKAENEGILSVENHFIVKDEATSCNQITTEGAVSTSAGNQVKFSPVAMSESHQFDSDSVGFSVCNSVQVQCLDVPLDSAKSESSSRKRPHPN